MAEDPTLQRLLGSVPLLASRPAGDWATVPLVGITNRSWRVRSDDFDLVLRAPGPSSSRYLSRAQEFRNSALAAGLGIAPALLYADVESGVTLQPFLTDARALEPQDLASPEIVRKVGALLGRLHRSGLAFAGEMAPFPITDRYLSLAGENRRMDPELRALRLRADPIRKALEASPPPSVPSHIDPNPANFLLRTNGALLLIDWEFSAMCEPAWDLAAVTIEGGLTAEAATALGEGYGWVSTPEAESRLWLMRAALHLVAASWTAAEIAGGNPVEGLAQFLERRIAGLRRMLDDPALTRHLDRAT